jgi:hypothetical protein
MKAGVERLVEAHEEVPRHELAAVRVARKLEVDAGVLCLERGAGLMREQDANDVLGRPGERAMRIARMLGDEPPAL